MRASPHDGIEVVPFAAAAGIARVVATCHGFGYETKGVKACDPALRRRTAGRQETNHPTLLSGQVPAARLPILVMMGRASRLILMFTQGSFITLSIAG